MNKAVLYCIVLLVCSYHSSFSQNTTLIFKNNTYAGDSIFIYTSKDLITQTETELASGKANDSGFFQCSLNISTIKQIYIPLDLFKVSFYVEPGKTYHIKIPPKKKLDIEDELNPFFKRIDILPGIMNSDSLEINYLINSFDEIYDNFLAKYFNNVYYRSKKAFADSAISSLENKFSYSDNPYFKVYMEYKNNMLRYLAYERDENYIIKYRFNNWPIQYENTAYMLMFNDLFKNYLSVSSVKKWGNKIVDDISKSKSPFELRQTLKNNPAFSNDSLIELVILKGLHDAFFAENRSGLKRFPGKQLFMTLDSMICCPKYPCFKSIAEHIKQKAMILAPGTYAPPISLLNKDSVRIGLTDLRGKYLLINFYDFRSYTFLSDMNLLKNTANKFANQLEIVTIVRSTSPSKLNEFTTQNDFNWQFLISENEKELFKNYQVSAFPGYYLLDPYGKITMAPSPGPDGNFDAIFARILTQRN